MAATETADWYAEAIRKQREHEAKMQAKLDESVAIPRTARKSWRCTCADPERHNGRANPNYPSRAADCRGDIAPGDRYVEYVGEAAFAESGHPYCWACGVKVWSKSDA